MPHVINICCIFAFVKKLVFEYLNTSYPNAYIKKTRFGNLLCGYNETNSGWLEVRENMGKTVMRLFSCNLRTSDDIIKEWCETRPILGPVVKSTNDEVLVLQKSPQVTTFNL